MKVINSATLAGVRVHARYCEGEHCGDPDDEMRAYPLLFAARVILVPPVGAPRRTATVASAVRSWAVPSTGRRGTGARRTLPAGGSAARRTERNGVTSEAHDPGCRVLMPLKKPLC